MDNNLIAILIGLVAGTLTTLCVTALRTRAERLAQPTAKPKRKNDEGGA